MRKPKPSIIYKKDIVISIYASRYNSKPKAKPVTGVVQYKTEYKILIYQINFIGHFDGRIYLFVISNF